MITFFCAIAILIAGYFVYGKLCEKVFCIDDRKTPAYTKLDDVDFMPINTWKTFLIQLLNIAGTGPIFGALMGAVFGPVVFLWIVFGGILAGAVADYFSGMISLRMDGASITAIVGKYLGKATQAVMIVFTVVLMILVGSVFTTSPAALLGFLTPEILSPTFWAVVILIYYVLATVLPIDKVIGRIYPIFGVVLIVMAIGMPIGLISKGYVIPELTLQNLHPDNLSPWPFMFVTTACGAISGFHATQSPIMARCIKSEGDGRITFYGAMIAESVIALIWAAAGVAFYQSTGGLQAALASLGQSGVVYEISTQLLGTFGGALAIVGVVVCPISSGDTAFRSARLIVAEQFNIDQTPVFKRFLIALPMLIASAILTKVDFTIVWRYFAWANQTLAAIVLWALAVYLFENAKKPIYCMILALPASFMTAVCTTYILMAQEGLRISSSIAYPVGIAAAIIGLAFFIYVNFYKKRKMRA